MTAICAGWCRCNQRLMIPENIFIIQIKVIIPDLFVSQTVIKGRIQMIICPADLYDIPGMTIFDPFLRVIATDGNDVPDAQRIQKHLYRFCNSFTDTDPLSQWSDDLMRIRFFQLVIPDILTDKIMYIFLFFQLGHRFCRTHQLLHTGCHCFLMFPDFCLFKQILRQENQIPGILIIPILKSRCPENLRMIKT